MGGGEATAEIKNLSDSVVLIDNEFHITCMHGIHIFICGLAGIDMVFLQAGLSMANTAVYSLHKTATRQVGAS